jgi:colanic acid/amylovoran biosynthesis glycosyltransferase
MNAADLFLFPGIIDKNGRCEAQGLVVQEAQAMKLPVIVSNVGGMKEGIVDNKTGFVVKENDINGFVEKLEFLINNSNKKEAMGEAARAFVVKNYDSTILGEQLLYLYTN